MSGCNSCETVTVDPELTQLEPSMTGGAKKAKKAAPKKTKKAAPKKTKKAAGAKKSGGSADAGKTCGGSFLENLGQLAIPLGLIAAKEGVEMLNKNSKNSKSTSKKASGEKTKTKTNKASAGKKMGARRASFGGDPEGSLAMDSAGPYPSSVTDGLAATPVLNSTEPTTITTGVSDDSLSTHMGGAERSSIIAQEFRNMANEINSFLEKHKKKAKAAKAAKDAKKKAAKK